MVLKVLCGSNLEFLFISIPLPPFTIDTAKDAGKMGMGHGMGQTHTCIPASTTTVTHCEQMLCPLCLGFRLGLLLVI